MCHHCARVQPHQRLRSDLTTWSDPAALTTFLPLEAFAHVDGPGCLSHPISTRSHRPRGQV
jgi:hypothetical protein